MGRFLAGMLLIGLVVLGGLYVAAGRAAPPVLTIDKPERLIGQAGTVEVTAGVPRDRLTALTVTLEQNGRSTHCSVSTASPASSVTQVDPDHLRVTRPLGKQSVPDLQAGGARIVVTATRKSFLELADAVEHDRQGLSGPPRAAAHRRGLDAPLRQSRRIGNGRLPRHPADVAIGRARRRRRVSRLSGTSAASGRRAAARIRR